MHIKTVGTPKTAERPGTFNGSPPSQTGESTGRLVLTVVFTSVRATLAAARRASALAHELDASIQIVVPCVVPYPLPLDRPQADPNLKVRSLRAVCEQAQIESRIEIKLCRDARECLMQGLGAQSIVLIGDNRGWPLSRPRRLAKSLQRGGHHVLVVRAST